jgi:sugar transferase (PEP-CTERM/EpsH1 system associated)
VRVVFLTHRLPYAPNRGDRIRAFNIARALARQVDLEVVSLAHDDDEMGQTGRVEALGARATAFRVPSWRNHLRAAVSLTGTRPLTHVLLDAPGVKPFLSDLVRRRPPDVVLSFCSGMVRFALEPPLSSFPLVLDMVDVDSEKWASLARSSPWPRGWIYGREARCLAHFERHATRMAATTLVINERERVSLEAIAPGAPIQVIGAGIDLALHRPPGPPAESPRLVFSGVMDYVPNIDGVLWFAREIWPMIRAKRPDARFVVVGADPPAAVRRLAGTDQAIEITGRVPDVREYLWNAAVSVAPLLTARGLQTKVLEALAAGLPVVVTPQVFEGLRDEARSGCRLARDPKAFAEHVLGLLALTGPERRAIAASARLSALSWESQLAPLPGILAAAASMRSR